MIDKKVLPILIGILMLCSIGASAAATTSYNTSQIGQAAISVKHSVDNKYTLPSNVIVGSSKVTNSQFLYLLTKATKNVATGNKNQIQLRSVSNPTSTSETITGGKFTKTQYLTIADQINTYITANNIVPSYVTTPIGKMKYQSLIYMFSNIMAYNQVHKTLPSTVTVKSWYAQTLGPAAKINSTTILNSKQVVLGSTSYGKVIKIGPFGKGTNKVAVIVGVHPQEVQTHIAMLNAIGTLSKTLNNVQIWVYDVIVYNGADYSTGRMYGQLLAQKYVVPNINTSYKYVIDTHGNRGTTQYDGYPNFVFAPDANTKSVDFAYKLINSKYTSGSLKYHTLTDGTSPAYVTIPIAKKGIPTIVYEEYQNQANYAQVLYQHALQVIRALNAVFA